MADVPAGHQYHLIDGDGGVWLAETCDEYPEPSPIGLLDDILKDHSRIADALAICDEWDRLTKGPTPTTERIRGALTNG